MASWVCGVIRWAPDFGGRGGVGAMGREEGRGRFLLLCVQKHVLCLSFVLGLLGSGTVYQVLIRIICPERSRLRDRWLGS